MNQQLVDQIDHLTIKEKQELYLKLDADLKESFPDGMRPWQWAELQKRINNSKQGIGASFTSEEMELKVLKMQHNLRIKYQG